MFGYVHQVTRWTDEMENLKKEAGVAVSDPTLVTLVMVMTVIVQYTTFLTSPLNFLCPDAVM
jgi:hypothetical protein